MSLITTTVSLDAQKTGDQVTMHLVRGDSGTRTFNFIPISGGQMISLYGVAAAKVQAQSLYTDDPLLIDCTITGGLIFMVPTAALVANADEWAAQLVLLDSGNQTLHSMPFTIIVHGTVYTGDAIEHTNTTVTEIRWDSTYQYMTIVLADGSTITSPAMTHTHAKATATADGFLSKEHYSKLVDYDTWLDQDVSQDGTPTFASATIGAVTIAADGTVTGLKFT